MRSDIKEDYNQNDIKLYIGNNSKNTIARIKDMAKNNPIYRQIKQFENILKLKPKIDVQKSNDKKPELLVK